MPSLSSAKTLGELGGILVFFPFLSLVGWVLILLAINEISDTVQDRTIFDDALIAAITAVVGAVVFGIIFVTGYLASFYAFGFLGFRFTGGVLLPALITLFAFWVFTIISATYLKRAYDKMAQRLNVSEFATAGLLYLIGAATTIILIGFPILVIALIFQVVAYFSIQDRLASPGWVQPIQQTITPTPVAQQPARPSQQSSAESKFCFKCGAKIPSVAVFCTSCGAKQQ